MGFFDRRREKMRERMDRHLAKLEKRLLKDTRGPRITVPAFNHETDDYLARGWVVDAHQVNTGFAAAGAVMGIDRRTLEERHAG
jgi:DNA-binding IclR family transcriptional regulator